MFEIENLKIDMAGKTLLHAEHLIIREHKTIALIGRNGSGKTTLFKYILNNQEQFAHDGRITLVPQIKEHEARKSGGEHTKIYLQSALSTHASILLMDEPTTHLDENNLQWLIKQVNHHPGTQIIVSHDRDFINKIADEVWAIENEEIKIYPGNYDKYKEIYENEQKRHKNEYERYISKRKHLESAIAKKESRVSGINKPKNKHDADFRQMGAKPYFNKKKKKMDQVASSMKTRLEQLEVKEKPFEDKRIHFHTQHTKKYGSKVLLRLENENISAGDKILINKMRLFVRAGEHLSINGPNGSGKTTLFNRLAEKYSEGNLSIGFFHQQLESLDTDRSILSNIMNTSQYNETTVRIVLARLGIRKDDVYKTVSYTSGGERGKIQLVKMLMADNDVLLLDEPTNFLDIHSIEALEDMIKNFPGTILLASHDKVFRKNVSDKSYNIKDRRLSAASEVREKDNEEELMIIDTKISEVLGKMADGSNEELESEFQSLLKQKKTL